MERIGEATKEVFAAGLDALEAEQRTDAAGDVITGTTLDRLRERINAIVGEAAVTGIVSSRKGREPKEPLGDVARPGYRAWVLIPAWATSWTRGGGRTST